MCRRSVAPELGKFAEGKAAKGERGTEEAAKDRGHRAVETLEAGWDVAGSAGHFNAAEVLGREGGRG